MHDDDLRVWYDAYYDGYFMPPYDEAPNALKIRLRLALAAVDDARLRRAGKRARTVKALPRREKVA